MKMNTTTNTTTPERAAWESQRSFSGRRPQHHVAFFCNAPGAESVRLVGDFNRRDLAATPMQRMPDGRWTVSWNCTIAIINNLFEVDGKPVLDPNASGLARNDRNERVSLIAVS